MIIAIDGPAGAGKSTLAQHLAQTLDFQLVDTGAIYRSVAWKATENGLDLTDGSSLPIFREWIHKAGSYSKAMR